MKSDFFDYFERVLSEEEMAAFKRQLSRPARLALRVNTLLMDDEPEILKKYFKNVEKIPWSPHGYFYESGVSIGNTELYEKGKVYSQEASSQIAVELLDVHPGQTILDLCASPGSKTTQIAAVCENDAFVIANEVADDRHRNMKNNLKHFGVICTALTNLDPAYFATSHPNIFDRILVDAPCSGEGMYFKFPAVIHHWNIKTIRFNAKRQKRILLRAFEALKPGGKLVYSTCTLNLEEDEKVVEHLLKVQDGNAEIVSKWLKIWPHEFQTGGFFACAITKKKATARATPPLEMFQRRDKKNFKMHAGRSEAKAMWQICDEKESRRVLDDLSNLLKDELKGKDMTCPDHYLIVKHGEIYFFQHEIFYQKFSALPIRSLGIPVLVTHEDGTKKTTEEILRWLNIQ